MHKHFPRGEGHGSLLNILYMNPLPITPELLTSLFLFEFNSPHNLLEELAGTFILGNVELICVKIVFFNTIMPPRVIILDPM